MSRPKAIYVLDHSAFELAYGPEERTDIAELVDLIAEPQTATSLLEQPRLMADIEVMLSGWGAPVVDSTFLTRAPRLRAIFYAAGAIGQWASEAVWERGVTISTANSANARPVAEYTLAMIILGLKRIFTSARLTREGRQFVHELVVAGTYRSTVGLLSFGVIARHLRELLRPLDVQVQVCDPFLSQDEADRLGVRRVTMQELFATSDVVSVHTPLLPETAGLIRAEHFSVMQPGATFINTARGGVVAEADLIAAALARADLEFILDVTEPEPPVASSPLYDLPNVVLTPHIAGSTGPECRRLGRYMADDLKRFVHGQPLLWSVSRQAAQSSTHRPRRS